MANIIMVICPHCYEDIIIQENEINCAIFRHGILKENYQQIPPHSTKQVCDMLAQRDLIYGCGKPFKLIKHSQTYVTYTGKRYSVEICDYI